MDLSELCRLFMGMVNHLGKFSCHLADFTFPLYKLLSPKKACRAMGTRTREQFCVSRRVASQPKVLALYQPERNLKFLADASSYGLGAVLLQNTVNAWRPVAYAPRTLSEPEKS